MKIGRYVHRQGAALLLGVTTEEIARLIRYGHLKPASRRRPMKFDLGDLLPLKSDTPSQAMRELREALR